MNRRTLAAQRTGGIRGKLQRGETRDERVVGEKAPAQRLADAGDELDRFECLQASNHTAQRTQHARFAAARHAAGRGRFRKKAAITGTAARRLEDRDLAFELENASVDERPPREKRRVVVEIARAEIVGPIEDHIVAGKQIDGVRRSYSVGMRYDPNERIRRPQTPRGRLDLGLAHGCVVMQELPLQVVRLDAIEVGDAERADSGGGEIQGRGAAESAGSDDKHARRGELLLPGHTHLIEQDVPAVAREFGGREVGQRSGHLGEREPERAGSQLKLHRRWSPGGMAAMRCLGIDYGARRVGLSYGDDLGVATPLPALIDADPGKRWTTLLALIAQRRITDLVLGYPLNMDDTAGFKSKEVDAFAARLRAETKLPVHLVDERLTSYEAESTIAKSKRRDIRASGIIDSRAATLILQDYLMQKIGLPPPPEDEAT